jgi:hypothetical protein
VGQWLNLALRPCWPKSCILVSSFDLPVSVPTYVCAHQLLALMLGVLAATQSVVEHGFIHMECDADLFGCSDSLSIEGVPQYLLPAG